MRVPSSLFAILIATTLSLPATAAVWLDVNVGPPEPLTEYTPPPRYGYVWSPGYWAWNNGESVWMDGYWMEERPGYVWVPDRWNYYTNGWRFERGHYYPASGRGKSYYIEDGRDVVYVAPSRGYAAARKHRDGEDIPRSREDEHRGYDHNQDYDASDRTIMYGHPGKPRPR